MNTDDATNRAGLALAARLTLLALEPDGLALQAVTEDLNAQPLDVREATFHALILDVAGLLATISGSREAAADTVRARLARLASSVR